MKKNHKRMLTLAVMMAVSPLYAAVSEIEPNNTIDGAQYVTGSITDASAAIGIVGATETIMLSSGPFTVPASTDDVDFTSFYANAGDVITLDIDNGIGGQQSVDTLIGLYDSNRTLMDTNDMANTVDSGSSSIDDARIDNFVAQTSGMYYVGVSSDGRQFWDGGVVDSYPASGGDYQLVITKVSPSISTAPAPTTPSATTTPSSGSSGGTTTASTQYINIEVRPGSREFAPINPNSKGVIPVALLSKNGFNALDINPAKVTFGAKGTETGPVRCNANGQDVNGDGLPDMLCFFNNHTAGFKHDSLQAYVRGSTRAGVSFEGHGITKVKIVGGKRKAK